MIDTLEVSIIGAGEDCFTIFIVCLINQFGDSAYFAFNTNDRANPIQIPIFRVVDHQIRSSPNDDDEEDDEG